MTSYKDRFSSFVVRHRLSVLLVFLIVSIVSGTGLFRIKSEIILWHLFPYDHPYFQISARFSTVFGGGGSSVVIAVKNRNSDIFNKKTLTTIKQITQEIELWDQVYRVQTNSMASNATKVVTTGAKGLISIVPMMWPNIPETEKEMENLKKDIFSNPAYDGTIVSKDGTAALIATVFKDNISYKTSYKLLSDLSAKYADRDISVHVVGMPMLMGWIYSHKAQMYSVFVASVSLMICILIVVFRSFTAMIPPIVASAICTCLGLGFIGWVGLNFSPLLYVLAFLVGARMLSNSVQITHRYIEEYRGSLNAGTAAYDTMRAILMPNATAVITDILGFMVLATAKIVFMKQIALMMSFWMLTIILTGILIPILCSFLPIKINKVGVKDSSGRLSKYNMALASFSMGKGKKIIWITVLIILSIGSWLTAQIKIGDPTPGSPILWPDHPYNQDQKLINEIFNASSETLVLYYDGKKDSVYDPAVLNLFDLFARHMAESLPDIYKSSMSINDICKMVQLTYRDGDQIWNQLPTDKDQLVGILGQVRTTAGLSTISRFVDQNRERAQILLFFSDHTSENMLRIKNAANDFFKKHPLKTGNGEFVLAGGSIGLEIALNEEMKKTHARMDIMVLIAIFTVCSIAFRSFTAGAMLALPLVLSNLVAFSYMSLSNIGLSVNTLPCSAVGVGVGVDFAIYLYSRCKEEVGLHGNIEYNILSSIKNTGSGIVFTGITLILPILLWYFISELKFQAQMGFFLAALLFINMIFAITLHPLLIKTIKPKFLTQS